MSAVLEAHESKAIYLSALPSKLVQHFELLGTAPGGVAKLRELILTLAVQGKLVPQDQKDEPASELVQQILSEKERLIADGRIKKDKPIPEIEGDELPFLAPKSWEWVRMGDVSSYIQRGKSPTYTDHSAHRVISQKCVRWHGLDIEPARYITADSLSKYDEMRFLQAGDLLWNSTGTGTIGRACLVEAQHADERLVADSHVTVVRPVKLISAFLWRWIQSPYVQDEIEGLASGTTNRIELNTSTVVSHLMPLPPLAEQARIVTRIEELMRLCDALEAKSQVEAAQHAQLVQTLLGALTASATPEELADNWQRVTTHFDLLLDRPEAVDALEQTILQLAVRGLLVPQDPNDEPANVLLRRICAEKDRLVAEGKIKRDKPLPAVAGEGIPLAFPPKWERVRLGSLIELVSGQHLGPSEYVEGLAASIPYLTGPAEFGAISPAPSRSTNERRAVAIRSDILITVKGSGVGKLNVVTQPEIAISRQLMAIRPVLTDSKFLMVVLETMALHFQENSIGIAIPGIGREDVTHTQIGLPPIAEQSRIVARVESLRRLFADLRQRLSARQTTQSQLAEALIDEVT